MAEKTQVSQFTEGQILSIDRTTKDGKSILNGSFSADYVAIPVPSLNAGLSLNSTHLTLKVHRYRKLSRLAFFWSLLGMMKRQDLILIYFPVLILLLKDFNQIQGTSADVLILTLMGLFFLILSLRIKNHVADHLTGIDRLNPETQQEPLMQGQIKITELNVAAFITLGLAAIFSIPLIFITPMVLIFLIPAVALGLFVQFFNISKFKSDKLGEFFIFCLFGPLYISGLDMVFIQQVQAETIYIGFYIGLCTVFLLNLRVFSNFLFMAQVHSQNSLIAMGFDRAKSYLQFLMFAILISFVVYQFLFYRAEGALASVILGGAGFWWFRRRLISCDSPVSSRVPSMKRDLAQFVYGFHLIWLLTFLLRAF